MAAKIAEDRKLAKANKNFYVPAEAKLAFVIRIRGYVIIGVTDNHIFSGCNLETIQFFICI